MTTLFISDLHLEADRPDIGKQFLDFMETEAKEADDLYILGDLFEQPLVMWAFIGWGWLSILVMIMSIIDTVGQL